VGYFAQAHEGLDPGKTVLDEILAASPGMLPYQGRDYLGKYLFSGDDVFKRVDMLSGGERGRLALAKLALQDTNLLLLDEPTNHLDIPSQEVLQAVLDAYKGTILLVTHDRYLVDALATQIWEIEPDESHLSVFNGTYTQMKEEREKEIARAAVLENRPASLAHRHPSHEANEIRKAGTKADKRKTSQLQQLERRIAALESELAALSAALENPPPQASEVSRLGEEYGRVQKEMEEMLMEWERMQI
jgi:ATP-binding cassette subfamily F protein 3